MINIKTEILNGKNLSLYQELQGHLSHFLLSIHRLIAQSNTNIPMIKSTFPKIITIKRLKYLPHFSMDGENFIFLNFFQDNKCVNFSMIILLRSDCFEIIIKTVYEIPIPCFKNT